MAFWTLEAILDDGRLDPARLAERFSQRTIFGIGASVREFLREYKAGKPWFEAAARSAGNGALMRIAPVLLAHLDAPSADLWVDAALAGTVTHNDPASTGACVAFTAILWELLRMDRVPDPLWWVDTYVGVARDVEGQTLYAPRGGNFTQYRGPLWQFVAERLPQAHAAGLGFREACDRWWSGAYLLETVPCALYALMLHASDPKQAIIRAVNDTKDNDTVAAIVGAAVGALHGRSALPGEWVQDLLGRTAADDDGRVFALLSDLAEWRQAPRVLRDRLAALEVGQRLEARGLTVYPLLAEDAGATGHLTMDQALARGLIEIAEVSPSGSVHELKLVNHSTEMVLLLEGDQLVGAKQNRTLNTTILVAGNSQITIPVSCVEAGRWHAVSQRFAASEGYSHPSLRREKVRSVHESLRGGRGCRSDQEAVWSEVDRTAACAGVHSDTRDYEAVHSALARDIGNLAAEFELPERAVGVAVVVGGRIEVIELLDSHATLQRLWPRLVRGYGLEAIMHRQREPARGDVGAREVRALLQALAGDGTVECRRSPGLGRDVRIETSEATGAALVADGRVLHCAVFAS